MSTNLADVLGIQGAGTIEVGSEASLMLVNGDLFNSNSQVLTTFTKGIAHSETFPERKPIDEIPEESKLPLMAPNYDMFPKPAETVPSHRLYRGATVWTASKAGVLKNADVRIQSGKIVEVGTNLKAPTGCEVVDAKGMHISPGIWDCHSHTGISGGVNEGSNMITAECRIADVIDHTSLNIYQNLAGGTVGVNQLHGSANAIGGQNSVVKWRWGMSPLDFPIEGAPQGVKFALGQNPIREDSSGSANNAIGTTLLTFRPRTRFGVEEANRRGLQLGKEYNQAWADFNSGRTKVRPRRDLQLEALGEMVAGTRWVHSHGYRADEMLMLIRTTDEYGVRLATLQHVLEGFKIADEMADRNVGGSTFSDWWGYKFEAYDAIPHNATLMANRGVSVSVNSDSGDHSRRLNHEAAKAIRYGGATEEQALSFVTIEPAKQLGIDKWTGSIEVGKDADLAIWNGNPLHVGTVCLQTYVDGVKRFDRNNDIQQRKERDEYLLAAKDVLAADESGSGDNPFLTSSSNEEDKDAAASDLAPTTAKFGLSLVNSEPGSHKYPRPALLVTGGMVHPMEGDPFIGDVLVGVDGKILAVGKGLGAPRGATRVDARGKHVYPGLIDPSTTLGINEIGQVPTTDDSSERGDFHPDYRIERAVNPDWETFGVARAEGVLAAIIRPAGAGIAGQAALVYTEGFTWEDLTIQGGVAMTVNGSSSGTSLLEHDCCSGDEHNHMIAFDDGDMMAGQRRGGGGGGNLATTLASVATRLSDAREYARKVKDATPENPVPREISLEALLKVAAGDTPIMIRATSATDIKAAVAWAEEQRVRIILYGCSEAGDIADWLAAKQVPVILDAVYSTPRGEQPFDHFFSLPARLHKAGVRFCLTTNDAHNVRQLRDMAGIATGFGLDREEAARVITLRTAQILGISHKVGALKPGLDGTLIITDGEIVETKTRVLRAFIQGREISLENRQTRLYDKYKARPMPIRN
ncbi:amidohydrolase family protein [Kamptonema cortianum]|nr:amidohydrolase family protein [Geitlerinema splendidum]MDK3158383.1 amidohydrolase family protein [Kamptonema cortianum]